MSPDPNTSVVDSGQIAYTLEISKALRKVGKLATLRK